MKSSSVQTQSQGNKLIRLFKWVDKWILEGFEKLVISVGLIVLSIVVVVTVVTRYFFGYSPDWSDELPRFLAVWITFIGMSYCVRKGEHVLIDILFTKLKGRVQKVFHIVLLVISFVFLVYLMFLSYELTEKVFASNQKSVTLGISMGYVYMAVPIGCFLSAVNFLHIIVKNLTSKDLFLDLKERRD